MDGQTKAQAVSAHVSTRLASTGPLAIVRLATVEGVHWHSARISGPLDTRAEDEVLRAALDRMARDAGEGLRLEVERWLRLEG